MSVIATLQQLTKKRLWKVLDEKTREKVLKGNYERIFNEGSTQSESLGNGPGPNPCGQPQIISIGSGKNARVPDRPEALGLQFRGLYTMRRFVICSVTYVSVLLRFGGA